MGRLQIGVLGLVLAAALAPSAHAVTFSGPTSFGTGDQPFQVTVSEFNGDSRPDLAVANSGVDNVSILLGDGSGGFTGPTNFAAGDGPFSVAAADFNGDTRQDLAVANDYSDNVSILLGNGSGGFSGPTNFAAGDFPSALAVADFNGDSRRDIAVANSGTIDVSILFGNGSGGFSAPTAYGANAVPVAIAVGAFNADSRPDLATANTFTDDVSVLLGSAATPGTFTGPVNYAANDYPAGLAVGNLNGDGAADLAVANLFGNNVSILLGNGSGGFSGPVNYSVGTNPYSVAIGDLDADNRADLAVPNSSGDNLSVLLGNGNGSFGNIANFGTGFGPRSVALGDFNDDGRPDLAVANIDSDTVSILLNTTLYVRPKVARSTRLSLVPAYQACSSPNRTHGPPLAFPSCNPPVRASSHLTVGTPDSNGQPLNASGTARYSVVAGAPGGPDDSDVNFNFSLSDVRVHGGAYADYTGELRASAVVRITDRANGAPERQATVTDIPLGVTVPCTATGGAANLGASCTVVTSFDAVTPGAVPEGKRSVWELGKLDVYDGGADNDADTAADNTLFAAPGLFVP